MTLDEAETRLSQERAYLIVAEHSGNPVSIALAQDNVKRWEKVVREQRLIDQGGWTPCVV